MHACRCVGECYACANTCNCSMNNSRDSLLSASCCVTCLASVASVIFVGASALGASAFALALGVSVPLGVAALGVAALGLAFSCSNSLIEDIDKSLSFSPVNARLIFALCVAQVTYS